MVSTAFSVLVSSSFAAAFVAFGKAEDGGQARTRCTDHVDIGEAMALALVRIWIAEAGNTDGKHHQPKD